MGRFQPGCAGGKPARQALRTGEFPPVAASPSCHPTSSLSTRPQPTGCSGGEKKGGHRDASKPAELLASGGVVATKKRRCLGRVWVTAAAFVTGKGDNRAQTHGATTLPPSPSHRLRRGMGQSTKLLANQLHSAPRSKPATPCTGWDPPSSPDKTKANPSSPQNISSAFPTQAEIYLPFALAEPGISFSRFPAGRINAGPALDRAGEKTATGCAASGARCSFLIVYTCTVAYRSAEGQRR